VRRDPGCKLYQRISSRSWSVVHAASRVMSLGGAGAGARGSLLGGPSGSGRLGECGAIFLVLSVIGLPRLSPAQNPVVPQTVAPVSPSSPATSSSAPPANRLGAKYLIAKDDLLDLEVVGVQELSHESGWMGMG